MPDENNYYVLKERAVPEVLLKVMEAKKLLDSGKSVSIQEAVDEVGISRSSFYKYKDDIFPFHENERGRTFTVVIRLNDEPGLLSKILLAIAEHKINILTIHQSVPINGIASLILSIDMLDGGAAFEEVAEEIEKVKGIHYVKIIAKE